MSSVILTYSLQEERQKVLKNNKYCSYSANVALINLRDSGISKHVASKQMISLINNQLITRAGVNVCVMNKVGLGGELPLESHPFTHNTFESKCEVDERHKTTAKGDTSCYSSPRYQQK